MTRRVRLRKDAPHIPVEHRGDTGEIVKTRRLSFGRWYLVRFADGCELWTTAERVEPVAE